MAGRRARLVLLAALLLLAGAGLLGLRWFTRAGDPDDYRSHLLPASERPPTAGAIAVTWLGTSTLLFDDGETQLMIDGFISRPSLWTVMTSALRTDTALVDRVLERIGARRLRALFVVHSHYDHALDAPYIARTTGAQLHGSPSTLNLGRGGGVPEAQLVAFAPGRELAIGRFAVTILASRHTPPTAANDNLGRVIERPLAQPIPVAAFAEGGSFDVLIRHGGRAVLVKASTDAVPGALDGVRADVLFLGTAQLGRQDAAFRDRFYAQTVGAVRPTLVVPIHWDDFFAPLTERLVAPHRFVDDLPAGFAYLIGRLAADGIRFGLMQGFQRVLLFEDGMAP